MTITTLFLDWVATPAIIAQSQTAFLQKGGWEGWLQVEFASYLQTLSFQVQREYPAYTTAQRADILAQSLSQVAPPIYQYDIVELKTESLFQSGNTPDDFINRVEADIAKGANVDLTKFAAGSVVNYTTFGVAIAQQTAQAAQTYWSTPPIQPDFPTANQVIAAPVGGIGLYVFYKSVQLQ